MEDLPVFDYDGALRLMSGDLELLQEIVVMFSDDGPRRAERLKTALETGDKVTAEREAHSIKGASANVGAERVRATSHLMERACKDSDLAKAAALLPQLNQEITEAIAEARRILGQ